MKTEETESRKIEMEKNVNLGKIQTDFIGPYIYIYIYLHPPFHSFYVSL